MAGAGAGAPTRVGALESEGVGASVAESASGVETEVRRVGAIKAEADVSGCGRESGREAIAVAAAAVGNNSPALATELAAAVLATGRSPLLHRLGPENSDMLPPPDVLEIGARGGDEETAAGAADEDSEDDIACGVKRGVVGGTEVATCVG